MLRRPLHRSDLNQSPVIKALRDAGVLVEIIGEPVDLMTLYRGVIRLIEVKSRKPSPSALKRQKRQEDFLRDWSSGPVCKAHTIAEALAAHNIEIQG